MLRKFNIIIIVGVSLFHSPSHTKDIPKGQEYLPPSVEEITKEMIDLNSSLDLLSITIQNLVPGDSI